MGELARRNARLDKVAIGTNRASRASQTSIRISFIYIVALFSSIVRNFVFNLCNEPYITNFIVVNQGDYFTLPSYIHTTRTKPRDYIGTRTLLYPVRT